MRAMPYPRTIANGTAEAASKAGPESPPAAAAVVTFDVSLRVSTRFLKIKGTCTFFNTSTNIYSISCFFFGTCRFETSDTFAFDTVRIFVFDA